MAQTLRFMLFIACIRPVAFIARVRATIARSRFIGVRMLGLMPFRLRARLRLRLGLMSEVCLERTNLSLQIP